MAKGKIFVCCHFDAFVEDLEYLVPLAVGASGRKTEAKFVRDDGGDNISHLNDSYCELTGLYWAWKNTKHDYYGLCHYRRYFDFRGGKAPYILGDFPTVNCLTRLGYSDLDYVMADCDIVVPTPEDFGVTAYEHYKEGAEHFISDLDTVVSLIKKHTPEYAMACDLYLNGKDVITGNMAIFTDKYMDMYCNWLFMILQQFDMVCNKEGYGRESMRVNGYLAERMLGIFVAKLKQEGEARIAEFPKKFYLGYGTKLSQIKARIVYNMLPPNSNRRKLVRKIYKKSK